MTNAEARFNKSHIRKVYACLAVTCHLHFWQNDRDFLRATVVTRGWNGYRNKSQHRKSTDPGEENSPAVPVPETMICSQKYSGSRCLFPKSQSRDSILTWYFSPFSIRYIITGRAAA